MSPRFCLALYAFAATALAADPAPVVPALPVTAPAAATPAVPAAATPAAAAPAGALPAVPGAAAPTPAAPPAAHVPGAPKGPAHVTLVSTPATDIAQLAWMHGCWAGTVNKRAFTEQWTAPAAGLMLGLGHTVMGGKTESFEFMRIETQANGKIAYITRPSAQNEDSFVFEGVRSEPDVDFFVFTNTAATFPERIIYAHANGGRLFVHVQGKVNGVDREVVYPFLPVDCASGKTL